MITNLNPSEDYKTSVLSGLSPEAIMECAGRALSFWSYQMTQDLYVPCRTHRDSSRLADSNETVCRTWESHRCKVLTSRYAELSASLDNIIGDANAQLTALQNKVASESLLYECLTPRVANIHEA